MNHQHIQSLFAAIDAMDTPKFLSFLADDVRFQFGNWPEANGKTATGAAVDNFFGTIDGLSHKLTHIWISEGGATARGLVTYTRKDKSTVTIPFADTFEFVDGKITDYQIYMDVHPLFTQG